MAGEYGYEDHAPNADGQEKAGYGYTDAQSRCNDNRNEAANPEYGHAPEQRNVRRAFPRRGSCTKHTLEAAARANQETEIIILCAAAEAEQKKNETIEKSRSLRFSTEPTKGNEGYQCEANIGTGPEAEQRDEADQRKAKSHSSGSSTGLEGEGNEIEADMGDGPEVQERDDAEPRKAKTFEKSRRSGCSTELPFGSEDSCDLEGEGNECEANTGDCPAAKKDETKGKAKKGKKIGVLRRMRRGLHRFSMKHGWWHV